MSTNEQDERGTQIIPFGKYRGQPIDILREDTDYRDWLMAQEWFASRYPQVHTLIVNNFGAPSETPDHNALQARFLQHQVAGAAVRVFVSADDVRSAMDRIAALGTAVPDAEEIEQQCSAKVRDHQAKQRQCQAEFDGLSAAEKQAPRSSWKLEGAELDLKGAQTELRKASQKLGQAQHEWRLVQTLWGALDRATSNAWQTWRYRFALTNRRFENGGWDVTLIGRIWFLVPGQSEAFGPFDFRYVRIELKPALGDDYPAVLRQMKANADNATRRDDPGAAHALEYTASYRPKDMLVIGDFCARGATLKQVREIFAADNFRLMTVAELETFAALCEPVP